MKVRMDLYGKLPEAWFEYAAQNPDLTLFDREPAVVQLGSADQLSGLVTALGRLKVPARALYILKTA